MKKLLIFLLFTFSVYFCFADVIVQQKNFSGVPNYSSILNFNQFDPSNGTLTSVNVELSVSITNFSAIVDNDGVDSSFVDLELGAKGTISSDDVTLLDASLHSVAGPVTTWTGRHYDLAPNEGDGSEDYDSSPPDGASYSDRCLQARQRRADHSGDSILWLCTSGPEGGASGPNQRQAGR